ncbi:MAG: cyclase family protein [Patescibacteria group bacterium]
MNKEFKIIDLTHTLASDIPSWDEGCCFNTSISLDYKDCKSPNLFRVQKIEAKAGCGTHIDAPAHCFEGGKTIDQLTLDNLVIDCVVIRPKQEVGENYLILPEEINKFENEYGKIEPGTFVIFDTGWGQYWNDPQKYRNDLKFPSIHPDTAQLLIERNVSGIGIDTLSPDAIGEDFPVHRRILGAGKFIVENIANAEELPEKGAKIIIAPIKIRGGTEAPVRLMALI